MNKSLNKALLFAKHEYVFRWNHYGVNQVQMIFCGCNKLHRLAMKITVPITCRCTSGTRYVDEQLFVCVFTLICCNYLADTSSMAL